MQVENIVNWFEPDLTYVSFRKIKITTKLSPSIMKNQLESSLSGLMGVEYTLLVQIYPSLPFEAKHSLIQKGGKKKLLTLHKPSYPVWL